MDIMEIMVQLHLEELAPMFFEETPCSDIGETAQLEII